MTMLDFIADISAALLAVFVALVAGRAALLRRKGIKAIVFGTTDKTDYLLAPFVLVIMYAVGAGAFGWPLWQPLAAPFWDTVIPGLLGLVLAAVAVVGIVCSLASFGDSFRVGIDEKKPDKLVTTGMFAFSRNPIYACFDIFFLGQFLIHRNSVIAVFSVGFMLMIHRQILREEKFLRSHYGAAYAEYCQKVGRYLPLG
jgi:protein-S-isoprenylcysteine O-methyltransferase Ste14